MRQTELAQHLLQQGSGRGKSLARAAAVSNIHGSAAHDHTAIQAPEPLSHRERDDNYRDVIHQENGWRVILCRDGIQWIIQSRRNSGRRGVEWKGHAYCVTRAALVREWRRLSGSYGSCFAAELPEQIVRR